jgi:hypothetical protein
MEGKLSAFTKNKKPRINGASFDLSAGCCLQSSNKKPKKIIRYKEPKNNKSKVCKSEIFIKDLIVIHEFHRKFRIEIYKIIDNK